MHAADRTPLLGGILWLWLGLLAWALLGGGGGCTAPPPNPHEAAGYQTYASPQSNPITLSADGAWLYVANTTSNSVSLIRTSDLRIMRNVPTGLEPVSLAVRPNGLELWVSNHVSDSVSVIDVDETSVSFGQVIETIQSLDAHGATEFDEPVGIAFASNSKAYVALSSRNRIAIVDADSYAVDGFLEITAQDPRAIAVRNGKLYVAAFESGNRSQLSACVSAVSNPGPTDTCTLGTSDLVTFATQPNLPDEVKNIVTLPLAIPDRDVFVFSTADESLLSTAQHVGTLLYGLAVSADGTIYVSQTGARNLENGGHGDVLASLDGRMFDNEVAKVTCSGASCTTTVKNLEPGSPTATTHANSRATPYGIALSGNDATLLFTAAGVNRLVSYDTASMTELDVLDVGDIPKGVAFHAPNASSGTAYVLNTLGNTVSQVSVDENGQLALVATRSVGSDPTPAAVRAGNVAFNSAFASTTGSHSCGSCHPDGNTDQLLWRIGGSCEAIGCDPGDEPRSTMPIRGLRGTLPLHWDGTLGDPFGGGNGSVGLNGAGGTSCALGDLDGDHDCFLDLVDASLTGVMCLQGSGCPDGITPQQQDDMATFLASVSYPPARARRLDDTLSDDSEPADLNTLVTSARQGFADFFTDVNAAGQPRTCADSNGGCHALPLGAATNSTTLNGFDAPTMRGMTDRFLQFSMGPTAAVGIQSLANIGINGATPLEPELAYSASLGFREVTVFGTAFGIFELVYGMRPPDLWQMFEEASTGFSGALGRQVTLNTATAALPATQLLLDGLEDADERGVVNLRGRGLRSGAALDFSYDAATDRYLVGSGSPVLTQAELLSEAQAGTTLVTLTANLRSGVNALALQPLLATSCTTCGNGLISDPPLPQLASGHPAFNVTGTFVSSSATVLIDGQPVAATIGCSAGVTNGICNIGTVSIDLAARPVPDDLHILQVQNPAGLLSNELPICVAANNNLTDCISAGEAP
jgi:YVTN family beta-propeller protein